jgi:hypothetical protein
LRQAWITVVGRVRQPHALYRRRPKRNAPHSPPHVTELTKNVSDMRKKLACRITHSAFFAGQHHSDS